MRLEGQSRLVAVFISDFCSVAPTDLWPPFDWPADLNEPTRVEWSAIRL